MANNTKTNVWAEIDTGFGGLEAVRKHPGMYIGSTDARGSTIGEIVDNASTKRWPVSIAYPVRIHSDNSIEVQITVGYSGGSTKPASRLHSYF